MAFNHRISFLFTAWLLAAFSCVLVFSRLSRAQEPNACGKRPWIAVHFAAGRWPNKFKETIVADLQASLGERDIDVCPARTKSERQALARITLSTPRRSLVRISVVARDGDAKKRVSRQLSLSSVPPDGRAFAIALATDELISASWEALALLPTAPRDSSSAGSTFTAEGTAPLSSSASSKADPGAATTRGSTPGTAGTAERSSADTAGVDDATADAVTTDASYADSADGAEDLGASNDARHADEAADKALGLYGMADIFFSGQRYVGSEARLRVALGDTFETVRWALEGSLSGASGGAVDVEGIGQVQSGAALAGVWLRYAFSRSEVVDISAALGGRFGYYRFSGASTPEAQAAIAPGAHVTEAYLSADLRFDGEVKIVGPLFFAVALGLAYPIVGIEEHARQAATAAPSFIFNPSAGLVLQW